MNNDIEFFKSIIIDDSVLFFGLLNTVSDEILNNSFRMIIYSPEICKETLKLTYDCKFKNTLIKHLKTVALMSLDIDVFKILFDNIQYIIMHNDVIIEGLKLFKRNPTLSNFLKLVDYFKKKISKEKVKNVLKVLGKHMDSNLAEEIEEIINMTTAQLYLTKDKKIVGYIDPYKQNHVRNLYKLFKKRSNESDKIVIEYQALKFTLPCIDFVRKLTKHVGLMHSDVKKFHVTDLCMFYFLKSYFKGKNVYHGERLVRFNTFTFRYYLKYFEI